MYKVGDIVSSVGGFLTKGVILGIRDDKGSPIYKIKWVRDSRQPEPIDFVQERTERVIRPLADELQAKIMKKDDIHVELHKEGSKYRLYSIEPFGREKHLVCTWDSREVAEKAAELYFDVLYAVYEKMEDAVTKVAYDEAVKYLGASGLNMPYGDIYPEQLAEQTNDLVKLCTGLAQVAMQNAVDTEGKSVWRE